MIKAVIFDLDDTLVGEKNGIPFSFCFETLTQLKKNYKLALLSNTQFRTIEEVQEILRQAKLDGFFEVIVLASEVIIRKPNPKIFEIVLEKLGVNISEAVMVGNTISTDIFGGNRIGMRTVLFQSGESYQKSEWEHPDYTIQSLKELLEIVK